MSPASTVDIAEAYFDAWERNDCAAIANLLHPRVEFRGPTSQLHGRNRVVAAFQDILDAVSAFRVRSSFAWGQQAMCASELVARDTGCVCRAANLLGTETGAIRSIEWFYDPSPF